MDVLNYGMVGFGAIARTHATGTYVANLTLKLPYFLKLKSIVTRSPLEITVPGSENIQDIDQLLKDPSIRFIDICTPNDSHKKLIEKAAAYGKAIYCEKPLSINYADDLELTEMVNEKEIKNGVALMYRFLPAVRLIKEEIENKTIGDIIDFKINLYHKSYLDKNKIGTWRTTKKSGGGALLDLGVHLIDVIHFTLGNIEEVECNTRIFFKDKSQMDEIAECKFTLEDGTVGNLEVSRIYADMDETTSYVIYGTKGSIKMDSRRPYSIEVYSFEKNLIEIKSAKDKKEFLENYPSERNSLGFHQDCHMACLINYTNELYFDRKNIITPTFKDAMKAQKVIEVAYNSSKDGRKLKI
jgi:predicted dehydrogenase